MSLSLTQAAYAAALLLGVVDSGETLSAQQLSDILFAANNMLDNWSSDGLFALSDLVTTWALASGVQSYTIGAAQVISLTRPMRIVSASFANSSGPGGPIEVCNDKTWAAIPDRQRQSFIIEKLFWDRGNPTGLVYVSPVPQGSTLTGTINTWIPLTQFADTTTGISILPGYERAIVAGLAIEIAPQFEKVPSATLNANYTDAVERVRLLNASLVGDIPPELAAK